MNINLTDTQLDQLRALLAIHQDVLPDELLALSFKISECNVLTRVRHYIAEGYTVRRSCEIVSVELHGSVSAETIRQRLYREGV